MKKTWKRLCTGFLALATVVTALPTTPVHAESKQYWTESAERVGIIEKVMNDGSIGSTFNEGYMKVEGETAYCIDINTDFKNGYKTRADASSRMSADQISDVALSLEYVKQYGEAHKELNYKQVYLLEQCVVWQRLSVHLGWQCDNVRASYNEIPKATQDEVFSGAKAFVNSNKGFELIPPFEIVVARNNLVIDLGTLTDEYEKEISIHTTATSKDGEKTILAGKEVTIVDTVKLDGLTKGTNS